MDVTYHRDFAGPLKPAINVKVHAPGIAMRAAEVDAALSEDQADAIHEQAFERIASDFWQAASELAAQLGLGEVYQEGRSGGWLVIDGGDPEDIEDRKARREWLAAYKRLSDWARDEVRAAPARVAAMAREIARDRVGESAAVRAGVR